jgi:uncharacterized membrane protein
MKALYLLSIWLHIMAVVTWLGGIVFLSLVLIPALRRPEYRKILPSLVDQTGARFRRIAWLSLGLLVLTGSFNLMYLGFDGSDWGSPFGRTLGLKLLLVAGILALSVVHDFVIGPRATALYRENPNAEEARRLWKQAGWIGRLNLLLALLVVALGIMLVRGGP